MRQLQEGKRDKRKRICTAESKMILLKNAIRVLRFIENQKIEQERISENCFEMRMKSLYKYDLIPEEYYS